VKVGHRIKKGGEGFAVSGFKLLDEVLYVFTDELLCARRLPIITVGSRMDGGCAVVAVVALIFHCFFLVCPVGRFFLSPRSEAKEKTNHRETKRNDRGRG
jgi:hypothetical protein